MLPASCLRRQITTDAIRLRSRKQEYNNHSGALQREGCLMQILEKNRSVRVFFALWPTDAERAALAAWQPVLKTLGGGRAMRAETLHNTLVFIGDIEVYGLEVLQLAAQEVSGERFDVCFDRARYWGHNHIIYAAPDRVPPPLEHLAAALAERLIAHRFKFDRREYKPHVTLLRNARWSDAPLPAMRPVRWQIGDFALVQSVPHDGLTDYRVLARFPLGASGG